MTKTKNLKDEELKKVSGGGHQIPDGGITYLGYTNLKTCKFYASSKSLDDIAYVEKINGTIIEYYKYTILTSESRNTWSGIRDIQLFKSPKTTFTNHFCYITNII